MRKRFEVTSSQPLNLSTGQRVLPGAGMVDLDLPPSEEAWLVDVVGALRRVAYETPTPHDRDKSTIR